MQSKNATAIIQMMAGMLACINYMCALETEMLEMHGSMLC